MPMFLFAGFVVNIPSCPAFVRWYNWVDPLRYANEALARSQYEDVNKLLPQLYLVEQGFTFGFWKCVIACAGFAVIWRLISLIILLMQIKKFG